MNITITQKDIEKAGIQNSESGMLIDELAYAAKQWTSEMLYNENTGYEPSEPYNFDYEDDLLENTKTLQQLTDTLEKIDYDFDTSTIKISGANSLQAGAQVALNYPDEWSEILEAYTEKLKDERTDGISEKYNEELQEELDDWYNDRYSEWLNGDRDYIGVVKSIAKYFTDSGIGDYNKKENEYMFLLNDYDIEKAKEDGYNKRQLKKWILQSIMQSSENRAYADKVEREKRKAERERVAQYKKEQAEKERTERIARLKALTL